MKNNIIIYILLIQIMITVLEEKNASPELVAEMADRTSEGEWGAETRSVSSKSTMLAESAAIAEEGWMCDA